MPGFFKIDIDDFDESWTIRENIHLFPVFCKLVRESWRQDKPKTIRIPNYVITLRMNQLQLCIRQIARDLSLSESTCRDRLEMLKELGVIRIDEPVPRLMIVTVLWAYTYGDHGDRTPCVYRAPSVIDTRTSRGHSGCDPLHDSTKANNDNKLHQPNTDILEDCRLVDGENQNILVNEGDIGDRDVTSEFDDMDDANLKLEKHIPDLTALYMKDDSSLTIEQAEERARSTLQGNLD